MNLLKQGHVFIIVGCPVKSEPTCKSFLLGDRFAVV